MEIAALQHHVRASDLPLERLAASTQISQTDKVAEVSRQFEAVLLRQILGDAQKTIFSSTMNPSSTAGGVYQDMITNQLADSISRSGSFGFAKSLQKQLQHEFKSTPPPEGGPSKT